MMVVFIISTLRTMLHPTTVTNCAEAVTHVPTTHAAVENLPVLGVLLQLSNTYKSVFLPMYCKCTPLPLK